MQRSNGYTYTRSYVTTPYYTSHNAYSYGTFLWYQVPQSVSFFEKYLRPHHKPHSLNFPQYKNPSRASSISIKTAQTTALKDQALQKAQKRPNFASEPMDFYSPFHHAYGRFQTSQQPLKVKSIKTFQAKPIQVEPVQANIVQDRPKPLKIVLEKTVQGQTAAVAIQKPILPIRTTPKPTIRY